MKILALTEELSTRNGWASFSSSVLDALKKQGHEITILTAKGETPFRLPAHPWSHVQCVMTRWKLWLWLKNQPHFDIIYLPVEPYALLCDAFRSTPFVLTIHGSFVELTSSKTPWIQKYFARALHQASRITLASSYTQTLLPDVFQKKSIVIPHAVDKNRTQDSFSSIHNPQKHPLILSVGIIKPRKGYDRLLKGFAEFLTSHLSAQLVIVGNKNSTDPAYIKELDDIVRDLHLEDTVQFLGEISDEDLLGWYRACDVFALTSVKRGGFEGFGLVYLEANLFGKPSVGNRESGAISAIKDGVSGYLVDAENPKDIAQGIEKALSLDPKIITEYALEQNWDNRAKQYTEIFEKIVSEHASKNASAD